MPAFMLTEKCATSPKKNHALHANGDLKVSCCWYGSTKMGKKFAKKLQLLLLLVRGDICGITKSMFKYCVNTKYFIDGFSIYLSFQKLNPFNIKPYKKCIFL